jgi:hypothetical protein
MKINELVKTYKLLSDPNAPDWNVKFVSGIAVAAVLLAGVGAFWWASAHPPPDLGAPASTGDGNAAAPPMQPAPCSDEETLQQLAQHKLQHPDATALPPGTQLPSGCIV